MRGLEFGLIKPDGEYSWSMEDTLKLLLEKHFVSFVEQDSFGNGPRKDLVESTNHRANDRIEN